MAEHDKTPGLVIMVGSAKPSPWAKEGPIDDGDDEDSLDREQHDDGHSNAEREMTHEGGADSLIHLYHGLKRGDARMADRCNRLARCLQSMVNASHNRNENALRHWTREAAAVCDEIDSLGDHHDE